MNGSWSSRGAKKGKLKLDYIKKFVTKMRGAANKELYSGTDVTVFIF